MRQKMLRSKTLTGIALAVAAGCFWGTMAVSGQYMITACGFNAEELTTVRIAGAGILMLVLGMLTEKNFFGSLRYLAVCRDVCFYGLCLFVIQYTFFLAIHACNAGTAAIMVGFGPIFIILWNILVKRQKIVPKDPGGHFCICGCDASDHKRQFHFSQFFSNGYFLGTRFCRSRSFCDNSAEKSDPEDRRDQSCQLRNVCRRHFDLLHDAPLGDQRTLDAHGNRGSGFCRRIRDCRSILVLFEEHRIHSAGINFDSCFL